VSKIYPLVGLKTLQYIELYVLLLHITPTVFDLQRDLYRLQKFQEIHTTERQMLHQALQTKSGLHQDSEGKLLYILQCH